MRKQHAFSSPFSAKSWSPNHVRSLADALAARGAQGPLMWLVRRLDVARQAHWCPAGAAVGDDVEVIDTDLPRTARASRRSCSAGHQGAWWLLWTAQAALRKQDERSKQHNPTCRSAGGRPLLGVLHYFPTSFRVLWHGAVTRTCHSCILRRSWPSGPVQLWELAHILSNLPCSSRSSPRCIATITCTTADVRPA